MAAPLHGQSEQRVTDALRCVVAAYDGSLIGDDHYCDDLFERGLLRLVGDYTGEYVTHLTDDGTALVRAVMEEVAPDV